MTEKESVGMADAILIICVINGCHIYFHYDFIQ